MTLSAKQAAEQIGMTKQAVINAVKDGRISANKDNRGRWIIEPSELFRVFKPAKELDTLDSKSTLQTLSTFTPTIDSNLSLQNTELQLKLDAALEKISALESDKEDYKNRLDAESEERRKLTMMITDRSEKPSDKPVEQRKKILGIF